MWRYHNIVKDPRGQATKSIYMRLNILYVAAILKSTEILAGFYV